MTSTTSADAYVPGICNINHAEIAYRRKAGYAGLVAFVVIAAVLFGLSANRYTRLVLFLPAFIAAIGFLQAKNKFCVAYGAAGQQNATDGVAKAIAVADKAARAKDKQRARHMNLQAAGISVLITALFVLI
jgi:hypothetical protein